MGQAKRRGDHSVRVAEALGRIEKYKPVHIVCNNCQANLTEISTMDTRGMSGIDAVFSAYCAACNHNTLAVKGTPEAMATFHTLLTSEKGEVKTGVAMSPRR
jgi:hypothetical protein